jgi:hypothetical protein
MIKLPTVADLSSEDLLTALLASDRITAGERVAFTDMHYKLRAGYCGGGLSRAQRDWAERRYTGLELDAEEGALNLVSSGRVAKTSPTLETVKKILAHVPEQFRKPIRPPTPRAKSAKEAE